MKSLTFVFAVVLLNFGSFAQSNDAASPDNTSPAEISGMKLVWNDEFNEAGKPNPKIWEYERGFVRNEELQWYQEDNAQCKDGVLVIEGRREEVPNPGYKEGSHEWRTNRKTAHYTSASINTRGQKQWLYGRFEVRARIDTTLGSWPAIWTLGVTKPWPSNGEIDIMEFYRVTNVQCANNFGECCLGNRKALFGPLAHRAHSLCPFLGERSGVAPEISHLAHGLDFGIHQALPGWRVA